MLKTFTQCALLSLALGIGAAQAGPNTTVDLPTQTMPNIVDNPRPEQFQEMDRLKKEAKLIDFKVKRAKDATRAEREGDTIILKY